MFSTVIMRGTQKHFVGFMPICQTRFLIPANGNDWGSFFWSLSARSKKHGPDEQYLRRNLRAVTHLLAEATALSTGLAQLPGHTHRADAVLAYRDTFAYTEVAMLVASLKESMQKNWRTTPDYFIALTQEVSTRMRVLLPPISVHDGRRA